METQILQNRNAQVDIAKGIGIFFVIIGHLITYGHPIFRWIFSFHMPLFFFLSGYVFKYDSEQLGRGVLKTLCSLLTPYFLMCLFGLAVTILASKTIIPGWHINSLKDVIFQVFYFVQPECLHVGQVWFLFCLAMVQVLFLLLKNLKVSERMEILFVILSFSLSIGLSCIYMKIGGRQIMNHSIPRPPFKLDTAFMGLVFFYLGNKDCEKQISASFNSKPLYKKGLVLLLLLCVNLIYVIMLNDTVNLANNWYKNTVFFALSSITGVYFIFLFSSMVKHSKILEFYGKNSLPIFAFHSMFLTAYAALLTKILKHPVYCMNNIPLYLCFLGMFFVAVLSLPIPFIYKHTIGLVVKLAKKRILTKDTI